jgi:hypothetical protein
MKREEMRLISDMKFTEIRCDGISHWCFSERFDKWIIADCYCKDKLQTEGE